MLSAIERCPLADRLTILEENAGLHFLVKVDTSLSDEALVARCRRSGLQIRALSSYYHGANADTHCLVVNYSGLSDEDLDRLEDLLARGL